MQFNGKDTFINTELQLVTLANGLQTLPPDTDLVVAGVHYKPAKLLQLVREDLAFYRAARESRAAARVKAQARDERHPLVRQLLADVHITLASHLGQENDALSNFGFQPKKKAAALTHDEN